MKKYIKSSTSFNAIVDINLCDGAEKGRSHDTFYMKAHTSGDDVITIAANIGSTCQYDATYTLRSRKMNPFTDSRGLATGRLDTVLEQFFKDYTISTALRSEIERFAENYGY